jgi:DNA primase
VISEDSIKEIKERVSITEVVSDTVVLKRQGASLTGLCPFHSERSPSFHVREDDGYYHCFGCGVSGNVISFVMTSRGLSFPEALEYLAERFGIKLKKTNEAKIKRGTDYTKELLFANKLASDFYQQSLADAPETVKSYVQERNLLAATINSFSVGYASRERSRLAELLTQKGISTERQLQAGLVRRNERGEIYDTFRGRLVFPIALDSRRIVAFGGRVIPALFDAEALTRAPKYLNSSETPVYEKRKVLYGLPQAISSMREHGCVYVVEGYMDVVSLSQVGVGEVVATCGTALTEEHLRRLARLTKRVILLFDGDAAGRQAAGRSFQTALNSEIDIYALFLPDQEDPDTIARKHGSGARDYLNSLDKKSLFECYLSMRAREFQVENLSELGAASIEKIAEDVIKLLKQVKRPVMRERLMEEAAFRLRVKQDTLNSLIKDSNVEKNSNSKPSTLSQSSDMKDLKVPIDSLTRLEREILSAVMVLREKVCSELLHDALACEMLNPAVLTFVTSFREIFTDSDISDEVKKSRVGELLRSFGPSWIAHWKQAHQISAAIGVNLQKSFSECLIHIRTQKVIKAKIIDLQRHLATVTDQNERLKISQEHLHLERKLREVNR